MDDVDVMLCTIEKMYIASLCVCVRWSKNEKYVISWVHLVARRVMWRYVCFTIENDTKMLSHLKFSQVWNREAIRNTDIFILLIHEK